MAKRIELCPVCGSDMVSIEPGIWECSEICIGVYTSQDLALAVATRRARELALLDQVQAAMNSGIDESDKGYDYNHGYQQGYVNCRAAVTRIRAEVERGVLEMPGEADA